MRWGTLVCGTCLVPGVLLIAGCREIDIPPAGSYSEVVLVTEEGAQDPVVRYIQPYLSRTIDYIVEQDKEFEVTHVKASELAEVPSAKNILFCGVADPLTDVGQRIVSLLGESAYQKVLANKANIFKKEDVPAAGQLTVIVTGSSSEVLARVIEERGNEIAETIESSCRRRLREFLLRYEDKDLTRYLYQKYGFTIRVPTLYRLLSEGPSPQGIELLRDAPARLLGVFWVDWKETPTLADARALFDVRARYVWQRYNGDVMDSTRVRTSLARLGEYPAIKLEGYWSNSNAVAGGFFETYFIHRDADDLLWAVDLLVYAPGLPKHPLFRELEALAETFRLH
jgi:hypothetical protein